jgi:S1-C subfamily serine protease
METEPRDTSPAPHPLPAPPPPRADAPPPLRRGRGVRAAIAAVVTAALVAATVLVAGTVLSGPSSPAPATTASPVRTVRQPASAIDRTTGGVDVQAVANRVSPAVVDINTVLASFSGATGGRAAGTGMILTPSGEVLTNNHVIRNASTIRVTVAGRGTYAATVIGADPSADVALLQLRGASHLPTVTLADSSSATLGQEVVAIGNALGQGGAPTVTAGTITSLDRSIVASDGGGVGERLRGLIQTDATISPGDSGGALVNAAGQVVGMITAGAQAQGGTSTNVAFAIPSDAAVSVVDQIASGHPGPSIVMGQAGYLGIEVAPLDAAAAARLGLSGTSGVVVAGVLPGGPASRAGVRPPAVITAVDGRAIGSIQELGSALHTHAPGATVSVTWVEPGGARHTASVRLIAGPAV